jgi:hypothetical protein
MTVPTTGVPTALPTIAPATAPPKVLPAVPLILGASSFLLSSFMLSSASSRRSFALRAPTGAAAKPPSPRGEQPLAKQAGCGDPDAAAAFRRHDRRDHRRNRMAAAFGARLLQRPREKEAQTSPYLRGRQGRRAPLPHRAARLTNAGRKRGRTSGFAAPVVRWRGTLAAAREGEAFSANSLCWRQARLGAAP